MALDLDKEGIDGTSKGLLLSVKEPGQFRDKGTGIRNKRNLPNCEASPTELAIETFGMEEAMKRDEVKGWIGGSYSANILDETSRWNVKRR